MSGWAEDMGFVEDIQHRSLVESLQVAPRETDKLHPGLVGRGRGARTLYLCITSVLRSMAQVSRQHSTSEQM